MSSTSSIYLDYAAATPLAPEAYEAMQPYWSKKFYNPSAVYQAAREVRKELETARAQVAAVLGAKDQEIIFTAGGTEANNIAIAGVVAAFPQGTVVVSAIEHESVLEPARSCGATIVPVTAKGIVDLAALKRSVADSTVLISVMYANNEIGTIQPIKDIVAFVRDVRHQRHKEGNALPLYVHTDACQAANYLDLHVSRLGVDLMTLNGGKIYAPKQSGCLYIRTHTLLKPYILGGGQEQGLRSGTEQPGSIIAFATMLQKVQTQRKIEGERVRVLRDTLFAMLSQKIPHLTMNGDMTHRLPNNLNITLPGADGERLLMELDEAGIMVATGSACTAGNDEPSHVLRALGLSEAQANASVRITLGALTSKAGIAQASTQMIEIMQHHLRLV